MKTLIIFNSMDGDLQMAVVDGDYSRFNGIIINGGGTQHPHYDECIDWLFKPESGEFNFPMSTETAILEGRDWDKVAVITWIP